MASPTTPATVNGSLLQQLVAEIREEIPDAEVHLFGSHAHGDARPNPDIDLLITVTDQWLAQNNRFEVLDRLRWRLSQSPRPVDLLLFSCWLRKCIKELPLAWHQASCGDKLVPM